MEQILHIDGDILPYKVGFATQRTMYQLDIEGRHTLSPFFYTRSKAKVTKLLKECPDIQVTEHFYVEQEIQAINTLKLNLQGIISGSGCEKFVVHLSGDTNFRTDIATILPYKGNRKGSEKPYHWPALRKWLEDKPYTRITDNEEADDQVSIAMMQGHVGATIDKDLNNTPGTHYNFNKGIVYEVTEMEAMVNFYTQILTGDTADNIPGIKGIGPKTAAKILHGCRTPCDFEEAIFPHYEKLYGESWLDAMCEVGQLLWMRRDEKEVWLPTKWDPPWEEQTK